MKRIFQSSLVVLLLFLVLIPIVSPAFAQLSISVVGRVEDVSNDGYPDMAFEARDSFGGPAKGVGIDVTSTYAAEAFFSAETSSSGLLVFKNVPAGSYTWESTTGASGILEVEPVELNVPDEVAFLMLFLITKWCENTEQKGLSILKGLANLADYDTDLPKIELIPDNFDRAKSLYFWLSGLEDQVLVQRDYHPGVFTDTQMGLIFAAKDTLAAIGDASKQILTPPSLTYATDGYVFNYLVDRGGALPINHMFAIRNGFQGFGLLVISLYDLFIFQGTDVVVRVITLGEATWEERITIALDFATICSGFARLAATIGRAVFQAGAAASTKLMFAANAIGGVTCFLSAILILLELGDKYGGNWNRVIEDFATPYVVITMAGFLATVALGVLIMANLAGLIPAGTAAAFGGPIFWAVFAVAVIATVLKAVIDWITEYWDYVDQISEQISVTMDNIVPIRQLLYSYSTAKLREESGMSLRIAEVADIFAHETRGELAEDLQWANEYFVDLSETQEKLADSIDQSRPVIDMFTKTHLYYDSDDGTKRIRGHLEGINSTNAQNLDPGPENFFSFVACVYHPSKDDDSVFVFDKHTITHDNLDGNYIEIEDYSEISRHDPWDILDHQKGWAWEPPVERDAQDRTFAVTYATDEFTTGSNFYFDPAGQWYASPSNPWKFNPDANYRGTSKLTLDSEGSARFFYHYKFFFDPGTTGEYWGLGRPDALDEWMQNIASQLPALKTKLNAFSTVLNELYAAFSRKRYVTATEPIEKGLAWLRTSQYGDGSWRSNVGVTSLTALAFLNAGFDETDPTVSKAISYILNKVHGDGSIYASYSVYETSTAILALVATRNENYATIIANAKNWLIGAQQDETFGYTPTNYQYGGWTYSSARGDPDLSNSQFALLALDAANLPETDPTWSKAVIFTQRCQNRPASNDQAWAHVTTQPSYNDGGFVYRAWGWSLAGGTLSYGSMTGAGIWGLLLSGVPKTDERVIVAINWVTNHYTWDNNPVYGRRPYYYYLSMSKALTMYGEPVINGHDWYQELYNKLIGMQIDAGSGKGYWSTSAEDYNPELTTAYAILSLQTRAVAPPVQRLSYLTFILRSNCCIRILDSEDNLVGYNYMTGLGENRIPTAVYSGPFSEPQYIVIINPKAGTYQLELIGISEGPYELTIQGNYGEEVTDTFEYTGYIKPAELHGSDVTVTAIVGPVDIYTAPPEFEEIIDNIPPTTTLEIGEPKYATMDMTYVTPSTQFTLVSTDDVNGSGVASTWYRILDTSLGIIDWIPYSNPFSLSGLVDGTYTIEYYSIDQSGNREHPKNESVTLFSWDYVYEDCYNRQTILKINTPFKFIQFTTPDHNYGIIETFYMIVTGRTIIIRYSDERLFLTAVAVDEWMDFCFAFAWDRHIGKRYVLVDKPRIERKSGSISSVKLL